MGESLKGLLGELLQWIVSQINNGSGAGLPEIKAKLMQRAVPQIQPREGRGESACGRIKVPAVLPWFFTSHFLAGEAHLCFRWWRLFHCFSPVCTRYFLVPIGRVCVWERECLRYVYVYPCPKSSVRLCMFMSLWDVCNSNQNVHPCVQGAFVLCSFEICSCVQGVCVSLSKVCVCISLCQECVCVSLSPWCVSPYPMCV